jgi:hypothetical protein
MIHRGAGRLAETLAAELLGDSALRRSARRRTAREFRPGRLPAAFGTALALTAAGGAGTVLVVSRLVGHPLYSGAVSDAAGALRRAHWHDGRVVTVSALLAVAGLLLIAIAAYPGRTRHEPLRSADPLFIAAISRAGLRQAVVNTALGVPGIARCRVRMRGRVRRRILVDVTTGYRIPGNLADKVRTAVFRRLDQIDPLHGRRVVVRVKWRRG